MAMPDPIDGCMERALHEGVFPGAALLVARGEQVLVDRTYGHARLLEGAVLLSRNQRFDLASVSKALATSVAAMFAWQDRVLRLSQPLEEILPLSGPLGRLTAWHLLSHSAGLPAWLPLHEEAEAQGLLERPVAERRAWMRRQLREIPLSYEPATRSVYSDLGFMVLEWLLEQLLEERLDDYLARRHHGPLGLERTGFVWRDAVDKAPFEAFVATEHCPWRGRVLQGEVHDHLSWVMGGVSGQAGLFSTAGEVHRMLLDLWQSYRGSGGLLASHTVRRFWQSAGVPGSCFRLGWDGPSPSGYTAAGQQMDRRAVGHLGYTGCSVWLDPHAGYWVVLLTNRVHPTAENRRISAFRPILADLLVRALRL